MTFRGLGFKHWVDEMGGMVDWWAMLTLREIEQLSSRIFGLPLEAGF